MHLVSSRSEIVANCSRLSAYVSALPPDDKTRFALQLIEKGTCFLPVSDGTSMAFFPSRFIGYEANTFERHTGNAKDGRETNKAIDYVLRHTPTPDAGMENRYLDFCDGLGVCPKPTGNYGAPRRFWIPVSEPSFGMPDGGGSSVLFDLSRIDDEGGPDETQRDQLRRARVGQGKFRRDLQDEWARCPLSGCSIPHVLRASHIKPWAISSNKERLDPMNGLLLSANFDALFDRHIISFDEDGSTLVAKRLPARERRLLGVPAGRRIPLAPRRAEYMRVHRETFIKRDV